MVSRESMVKLRWLEASELQSLQYGPSGTGTIQHSQNGTLPDIACRTAVGYQ